MKDILKRIKEGKILTTEEILQDKSGITIVNEGATYKNFKKESNQEYLSLADIFPEIYEQIKNSSKQEVFLRDTESELCSANSIISEYIDNDMKQKKIIDKMAEKIEENRETQTCLSCDFNKNCKVFGECAIAIKEYYTKLVEDEE